MRIESVGISKQPQEKKHRHKTAAQTVSQDLNDIHEFQRDAGKTLT
jgi:hypothetical protein